MHSYNSRSSDGRYCECFNTLLLCILLLEENEDEEEDDEDAEAGAEDVAACVGHAGGERTGRVLAVEDEDDDEDER